MSRNSSNAKLGITLNKDKRESGRRHKIDTAGAEKSLQLCASAASGSSSVKSS